MHSLKDVLVEVKASWAEAGSGLSVKDALLRQRELEFGILLAFGVLMVAFLGVATWLLVTDGGQAAKTFGGIAGLGGSGGCFGVLLIAWKDWSRTDLLVILVDEMSKAQIASMINKLTLQARCAANF
jgi:hypothetical protein